MALSGMSYLGYLDVSVEYNPSIMVVQAEAKQITRRSKRQAYDDKLFISVEVERTVT
jgi:hypothetical protein